MQDQTYFSTYWHGDEFGLVQRARTRAPKWPPLASWLYWRRTSALSFRRSCLDPSNSSASLTRFQIITDFSKNTIQLQITMFFWTQFVGTDTENQRMEIIELKDHPFFVAVQYHPEYLSRPLRPSPPYLGLILAATGKLQSFLAKLKRSLRAEALLKKPLKNFGKESEDFWAEEFFLLLR